jgi:pilus assembly protein CpaF
MKLSEKLQARSPGKNPIAPRGHGGLDLQTYNTIKSKVHYKLINELDLAAITGMPGKRLSASVKEALQEITSTDNIPLNRRERGMLVSDLMNEIVGLGPIEPLMQDDSIQDILVNGFSSVYVEKNGVLHETSIQFRDNEHLMQVVDKIVSTIGRRIDEASSMVDARLPDGSRVNVIIPPLSLKGPIVSIRKFGHKSLTADHLFKNLTIPPEIFHFLTSAIKSKLNILISGGTGAGKTTLLNILSGFIPKTERIITIEDSAELRLHQPHVVSLESRPPNIEGKGEVRLTDLVKNSLRMRPDRIIVGEARGAEVMDMLQAMNTGHQGSMSTIHANSPKDALSRIGVMLSLGSSQFSETGMRALTAGALHIIVQMARLADGKRRVVSISEVAGMDKNHNIILKDIFIFRQKGVDADGKIYGVFEATGVLSQFIDHIRSYGIEVDPQLFHFKQEVGT